MSADRNTEVGEASVDRRDIPLDTAHEWVYSWIDAAERLFDLTARSAYTLISEQHAVALAMLDERSPSGIWRLQTGYALAGTTKAVAYARHASEIVLGTLADAVAHAESRTSRQYLAADTSDEKSAGLA